MSPEEVKKLRGSLGMTQEQLARELGVSFATVNRWENGKRNPTGLSLKALDDLRTKKKVRKIAS